MDKSLSVPEFRMGRLVSLLLMSVKMRERGIERQAVRVEPCKKACYVKTQRKEVKNANVVAEFFCCRGDGLLGFL